MTHVYRENDTRVHVDNSVEIGDIQKTVFSEGA